MRAKPFLAALLALAPTPALADVTAQYAVGNKTLTVEVDDGGNSRLAIGGKFAVVRRDSVDYLVVYDPSGAKVFKLDEMAAMIKEFIPKSPPEGEKMKFAVLAGAAPATVAGRSGAIWLLAMPDGPEGGRNRQVEFVMSADPVLAPVAAVFTRTVGSALDLASNMFPEETLFAASVRTIFAKGAPLRVTPRDPAKPEGPLIEFQSASTAEIDAKHFELPAPVTDASEIMGALGGMMGGDKGPVAPLP
jgi:hypothetical protein